MIVIALMVIVGFLLHHHDVRQNGDGHDYIHTWAGVPCAITVQAISKNTMTIVGIKIFFILPPY
jgi:hypothetical protein